MMASQQPEPIEPCNIRLVIADVDGTLVTPQKELTPRAMEAVRRLHGAGIAFTITSGRPPRGMSMLVKPLQLDSLMAAFNGGMFVKPDLSIVEQHCLPAEIATAVAKSIDAHKLDVWVYRGAEWFVRRPHGPHVDREAFTVQFAPTVVPDFNAVFEQVVKVVGVSADYELVAGCEADVRREFGDHVSASRSQPYYLDVTHPQANKGTVARRLSNWLQVPAEQIATIGDMPNDVLMFALSGLSIAMGNAIPEVQRAARRVTSSNAQEGFATAMERYVLCAAPVAAVAGAGWSAADKE